MIYNWENYIIDQLNDIYLNELNDRTINNKTKTDEY